MFYETTRIGAKVVESQLIFIVKKALRFTFKGEKVEHYNVEK